MPFWNHPKIFCPFHFMNEHQQKANVAFVEGYVVNQVLVMSIKNIEPGQELFVNYGKDVDRAYWNPSVGT
jgi:coenzyme F420-reducing hydrogenase gamma subunit